MTALIMQALSVSIGEVQHDTGTWSNLTTALSTSASVYTQASGEADEAITGVVEAQSDNQDNESAAATELSTQQALQSSTQKQQTTEVSTASGEVQTLNNDEKQLVGLAQTCSQIQSCITQFLQNPY